MKIQVLGPGCARCNEADALVHKVTAELGIAADVEKVSDFKEIMRLGVMATPAVVIDGVVKCTGRIPARDELVDWLGKRLQACSHYAPERVTIEMVTRSKW